MPYPLRSSARTRKISSREDRNGTAPRLCHSTVVEPSSSASTAPFTAPSRAASRHVEPPSYENATRSRTDSATPGTCEIASGTSPPAPAGTVNDVTRAGGTIAETGTEYESRRPEEGRWR